MVYKNIAFQAAPFFYDLVFEDRNTLVGGDSGEYSCAMKSHFRKFGNQMSGSGNHLCNYASLLA